MLGKHIHVPYMKWDATADSCCGSGQCGVVPVAMCLKTSLCGSYTVDREIFVLKYFRGVKFSLSGHTCIWVCQCGVAPVL